MGWTYHLRSLAALPDHRDTGQAANNRRDSRPPHQRMPLRHGSGRGDRQWGRIRQLALRVIVVGIVATSLLGAITACGGRASNDADNSTDADSQIQTFTRAGISLPRTKSDGPKTTDPFPRGYAHTPTGAALAAVNTTVVLDTAADDEWGQALAALVENDDAYRQWAAARQSVSVKPRSASTATVTIAGWVLAHYADNEADVEVYSTYPDGSHTKLLRHVRWSGQDWKIVLPGTDSGPVVSAVNDFPKNMVAVKA